MVGLILLLVQKWLDKD
ncbi:hypothetical protein M5P39_07120 [Streptococcus suis]|nr:hypothetical protein [Streptococcus suis]MCL4887250.1 hypothetical protein [Streptococcus suis]MCL4895607.1 hypothetical protein [Streptococcus suis]MCL4917004.1 hypothetical protein [Streptococcus suis]MCL4945123.1 hypothetical protein [Streptococcus suis]